MKKHLNLIAFIFISASSFSQNWNVFNKNYRYNYKFNNSGIVTNVLFVDTVKQVGPDTVYSMNRIAVECTANCPVIPNSAPSATAALYLNMPQFLQRKIKKYSNGLVMLQDTSKLVLKPNCTLNQTWLFDSIANLTATCVLTGTQTLFGTVDSVKTILVNADTIKLSKNFGIIVYPKPYAQNKYYRLAGIEINSSYDLTALHGEKVPNAWDFFNFNVGDVFTRKSSYYYKTGNTMNSYYTFNTFTVQGKSTSSSAFTYTIGYQDKSGMIPGSVYAVDCDDNPPPVGGSVTTGTSQMVFANLSSPSFNENKMYPGMFVTQMSPTSYSYISVYGCGLPSNLVKFGKDNTGRFYKYTGQSCSSYATPVMPNTNAVNAYNMSGNYASLNNTGVSQYCVGEGVGTVNSNCFFFEGGNHYTLGSAVKNGTTYFGTPWTVGLRENAADGGSIKIYPNPTGHTVNLDFKEEAKFSVYNALGAEVLSGNYTPGMTIELAPLPAGVYIFYLQTSTGSRSGKLVIER